ncbi:hypothetical protein MAPG_00948 [Magnaporthiopsis poae ATCC 64411]|uniref:Heterokaryon incompatibility domain-containing protein n=1 Tax=Magnaporthiopsis poae (strain ATCC 64411 / 73-15) TaxID=644358 RepID=A0A0C4DME2_MAGP6|nr:hypothetical protein MAPG_00948 [Magnaporthiopsis poae ATCC 64411]
MSRWHKPWCGGRDGSVQIEVGSDGLPHCHNCASSPDIALLLAQSVTESPGLQIPPDEPPGQLNLSWPATVPFSRSASASAVPDVPPGAVDSARQPTSAAPQPQTHADEKASFSPVYPKTLRADEFRLLVLDSRETPKRTVQIRSDLWPVHFELETHDDSDCPEYETVSYLWGGEEGGSSLCRPVYVGPFWDVLFQTKNCYDMLRLLRPTRGIRLLWVDAVCINQNNIGERNQQVAKMAFIYGHALRVVLYLGPDMISPLRPSATYPTRRRLEELCRKEGLPPIHPDIRFKDVLKRRYFRRVWVIQELLLSKQVLVRIRDIEFVADRSTSANLLNNDHGWNWADTSAPWLAYLSQGVVADPAELLLIVTGCQASDPRDNIFGVVGLMRPALSLVPDYTISAVNAHIGYVAHCLFAHKETGILLHPGLRNTSIYPSWVPWPARGDAAWRSPTMQMNNSWKEQLEAHFTKDRQTTPNIYFLDLLERMVRAPEQQWFKDANVNASTGFLSIRLTHLMMIRDRPVTIPTSDGFFMAILDTPTAHWRICLILQGSPHHLDLQPGSDHLFILYDDHHGLIYFLMRQSSRGSPTFRLTICCNQLYFIQLPKSPPIMLFETLDFASLQYSILEEIRTRGLGRDIRDSVVRSKPQGPHSPIHQDHSETPVPRHPMASLLMLQGILNDERGASPSFVDAFSDAYSQLSPRRIELDHAEYMELHLSPFDTEGMDLVFETAALDPAPELPSYWRRGPTWTLEGGPPAGGDYRPIPTGWEFSTYLRQRMEGGPRVGYDFLTSRWARWPKQLMTWLETVADSSSLSVLLPVDKLKSLQSLSPELEDLLSVGHSRRLDIGQARDDELALFLKWAPRLPGSGPLPRDAIEDPDYLLASPGWPRDLVEGFQIDGSTYQVTIE